MPTKARKCSYRRWRHRQPARTRFSRPPSGAGPAAAKTRCPCGRCGGGCPADGAIGTGDTNLKWSGPTGRIASHSMCPVAGHGPSVVRLRRDGTPAPSPRRLPPRQSRRSRALRYVRGHHPPPERRSPVVPAYGFAHLRSRRNHPDVIECLERIQTTLAPLHGPLRHPRSAGGSHRGKLAWQHGVDRRRRAEPQADRTSPQAAGRSRPGQPVDRVGPAVTDDAPSRKPNTVDRPRGTCAGTRSSATSPSCGRARSRRRATGALAWLTNRTNGALG